MKKSSKKDISPAQTQEKAKSSKKGPSLTQKQQIKNQSKDGSSSTLRQKTKSPSPGAKILYTTLIFGIISSIFLQRYLCQNWRIISKQLFTTVSITNKIDNLSILKQSLIYIGQIEFTLAIIIMLIRIIKQKICPVTQQDPLIISVINRILANNVEHAIAFYSVFSYLMVSSQMSKFLLKEDLEIRYVVVLPMMFLIGRVLYAVSYFIGSMVNVSSARSIGFAFVFTLGYLMIVEIGMQKTTFLRNFLFN